MTITERQIVYFGREGRRTPSGYKILHILKVDGRKFEIAARTKEAAIQKALIESDQCA